MQTGKQCVSRQVPKMNVECQQTEFRYIFQPLKIQTLFKMPGC